MKTKVADRIFRFIDDWEVSYFVDDELKLQIDAGALDRTGALVSAAILDIKVLHQSDTGEEGLARRE